MRHAHLLGLDAGGSGARAFLLDLESGATHAAMRPSRARPAPGTGGLGFDLDTDALWLGLCEATREVLARAGARPEDVLGVAAAGMRLATVLVDAAGAVLLAVPNRDARAVAEGLGLAAEHGDALYTRTGHFPLPIFPAARLRWLRRTDPERFARVAALLSLSDWIALRLCGEIASEPTQAGESGLFDLAGARWAPDWMAKLELPERILPALVPTGSRLGSLREAAAHALGLAPGTPVAAGGADTQLGLLGSGAVAPGDAAIVAGTTAPVQQVCDRPHVDAGGRLWTGHHAVSSCWVVESNAGPMGDVLDWLGRLLEPRAPEPAAWLLAEASRGEPGAAGAFSSFGGEIMNARAMNLPVGRLALSHLAAPAEGEGRRALARAVAEGMAFALRANLAQIAEVAGPASAPVRLGGGVSQSDAFASLLADALGAPVAVAAVPHSSALGAALCAGVGAGAFPDLAAAARLHGRARETRAPDPARAARSSELYAEWRRLRDAGAEADARAAARAVPSALAAAAAAATPPLVHRPRIFATADLDAEGVAALERVGPLAHESFRDKLRLLSGPDLVAALRDVEVFVTEVDVVDAEALAALPGLRVVASCRGDAVNVDLEACTAHGVPVLHAPGRNAEAVADLTLAFLLALARKLPAAQAFLRDPELVAGDLARMGLAFRRLRGAELGGRTVGLVGLGAVGRAVARRLLGFGARVLVHDPFVSAEDAALAGARAVPLDTLLAESDFVSLHAPVTDATRGLIGARELARMKQGACLVNTARAALVDEAALVAALEGGRLAGAALDVWSVEPPGADHPLLRREDVIGTPHLGGNTFEVAGHQGRIVAADLERLARGLRPLHALNPAALDGFDWARPRRRLSEDALARLRSRPAPAVSDLQRHRAPAAARGSAGAPPPAAASASPAASEKVRAVQERMRAILAAFVAGIAGDERLRGFSAGRQVALQFTLPDLELAFHFALRDGAVEAALGTLEAPEVDLRMRADVLDGMFTGRVNAMQAAMNGRLSFSGDAAKAMTLQHVQSDLSRLYRAAREAVGDPGDLAALPGPGGAGAPRAAEPDALKSDIVATVRELYASQLITATGGNVSARIPGEDALWITPSQLFKGDLSPEILVRIGVDGRRLDPDGPSPSSERMMHCAVYQARPEVQAVVHAHAPHATILANTGLPFLPISTEAAFFADLPRVPFVMPGTDALAKAVAEAMGRQHWAVLMVNHGLLVAGRSLRRAADMVEIIDRTAEVILGCYAVGREPPVLPPDAVATLRKMGDLVA